ncbi:Gfo/Idh/MocA family protein [Bacteroidota bacterium]
MDFSIQTRVNKVSRRNFIKKSAQAGAITLLAGNPMVYAQGSDKIRVGLIGCGGRGTGAGIIDCAESSKGIELVAIGDLFQDHIDEAPERIKDNLEKRNLSVKDIYKVTPDTTFVGFDAYQKVIDSGVDMVILTCPPQFRPRHLKAAVEAGKHVFMEKPVAVDPAGIRSVLESAKIAEQKGLTIVAGTQMRRLKSNRETIKRIHDGAIGEIVGGQCHRAGSAMRNWRSAEKVKKSEWSEMEYQIRRWLLWTWLSGDFVVEMHVHNLDVMNWIMNSHPVNCIGVGGRQARTGLEYGNIYDHISVEFEYPNDVRVEYMGTQIDNFAFRSNQRVSGTKGSAILDFRKGTISGSNPFEFTGESPNPSVLQYKEMIESIRGSKGLNEGQQIADSTMTAILGRMSAYTGKKVEWDWALNESKLDLSPDKMEFGDMIRRPAAVPGQTVLY